MPCGTTFRTWDDYFIPGTSVLKNKFTAPGKPYGEPDPDKLRLMEEAAEAEYAKLAAHDLHGLAHNEFVDQLASVIGRVIVAFERGIDGPQQGPAVRTLRDETRARNSDAIVEHVELHRASFPIAPTPGAEHSTPAQRSTPPAQNRHSGRTPAAAWLMLARRAASEAAPR